MQSEIVIEERFRGPPRSGNGGYVCGAFGGLLTGGTHALPSRRAAEVTLRSPVPLDTPLDVRHDDARLTIHHAETLVAECRLVELVMEVPSPPSYEEAERVRAQSPSFVRNASRWFEDRVGFHPVCFCCGAEHEDGLRVYAAPLRDNALVAAAWPTRARWADEAGNIPDRFIWTALDCPGQFAYYAGGIRTGMLGRLAARIEHPVRAGSRCVVTGWRMHVEGRRHFAGTALFDQDARLCAYAKAIWVGRRDA
ncbi:MAG: hypothetical protein EHM59_15260 [Betaproteobacteria bacterium]|nr:MAG: hypothetical protein EHM59_15260 [Betaproteobacteria bacterium]